MQIFTPEKVSSKSGHKSKVVFANDGGSLCSLAVEKETPRTYTALNRFCKGKRFVVGEYRRRVLKGSKPRCATADFEEAKTGVIATLEERLDWQLSRIDFYKSAVEATRKEISETKQLTAACFGC